MSNALIKIKNSLIAEKPTVFMMHCFLTQKLLDNLWNDGFITGYTTFHQDGLKKIKIFTKRKRRDAILKSLRITSKSSLNIHTSLRLLWKTSNNFDLVILNTSLGALPLAKCRQQRLGGKFSLHAH